MEQKRAIRKSALAKRSELSTREWDEKSHEIYTKVVNHPFFLNADTIYCYIDYKNEVGTRKIIETAWKMNKKVAIPKIVENEMHFYYFDSFLDLREGYRGIFELEEGKKATEKSPLVIMPGVAFDRERNRLGYGKGFYDRFLQKHKNCHTIAIGFEIQLWAELPSDEHDIRPEVLITEEMIYDSTITK